MNGGSGSAKKAPQEIQSKGPPPAPAGGERTATSSIPEIAKPEPTAAISDNGDNGPGADGADKRTDIKYLVRALIKYNASDLHLKAGRPPLYRINGKLIPAKMPEMSSEQVKTAIFRILSERNLRDLEEKRQVDLSFKVKDLGRFRVNVFYQLGQISAAIRMIPMNVPNIDELGVPSVLKDLGNRPRGIILVTGATGAGKSTTLASLVDYINEKRHVHILTIEDPVEFIFKDKKGTVTQRELGTDANTLNDALYAGLRQDPDVMVVGELRDREMIQTALTAAETGHLVISTLHTLDAKGTIDRIIDVFPADAKNQVRIQLASTLVAVICQHLLVRADGTGRVPACEVMIKSPAIENYILKNELEKIPEVMAASGDYYQMRTLNQDLARLVETGVISTEEALKVSYNPDDLRLLLSGVSRQEGYAA